MAQTVDALEDAVKPTEQCGATREAQRYGLSEPQSRILLRIVRDLVGQLPERHQLYFYAEMHQRWALNRRHFPTVERALEWQRSMGRITPAMWHEFSKRYPGGRL